jgi:hypothetical protein
LAVSGLNAFVDAASRPVVGKRYTFQGAGSGHGAEYGTAAIKSHQIEVIQRNDDEHFILDEPLVQLFSGTGAAYNFLKSP